MTIEDYLEFEAELEHITLVLWRNNTSHLILEEIHDKVFSNMSNISKEDAYKLIAPYRAKSYELEKNENNE